MTLDEIRALLAAPEAWDVLNVAPDLPAGAFTRRWYEDEIRRYCDERARTLAQALEGEKGEGR